MTKTNARHSVFQFYCFLANLWREIKNARHARSQQQPAVSHQGVH